MAGRDWRGQQTFRGNREASGFAPQRPVIVPAAALKQLYRLQKTRSEAGLAATGQFRIVFVLVEPLPPLSALGFLRLCRSTMAPRSVATGGAPTRKPPRRTSEQHPTCVSPPPLR